MKDVAQSFVDPTNHSYSEEVVEFFNTIRYFGGARRHTAIF